MKTGPKPTSPLTRFWASVPSAGRDECWNWQGSLSAGGYGFLLVGSRTHGRKKYGAHRFSFALHFGPVPPGMGVCHHCDNPRCVNPDHLFAGTQLANMQDARRKGRVRKPDLARASCRNGHDLAGANALQRDGKILCRACLKAASRRHYQGHREAECLRRRQLYHREKSARS